MAASGTYSICYKLHFHMGGAHKCKEQISWLQLVDSHQLLRLNRKKFLASSLWLVGLLHTDPISSYCCCKCTSNYNWNVIKSHYKSVSSWINYTPANVSHNCSHHTAAGMICALYLQSLIWRNVLCIIRHGSDYTGTLID